MRLRTLLAGVAVLTIATAALWSLHLQAAQDEELRVGQQAPNFSLPELKSGEAFELQALRGRESAVVVLFATYCPACNLEVPRVKELARLGEERNVRVVALSPKESEAKLGAFAERHETNYTILRDESGETFRAWGGRFPLIYGIDREGKIRFRLDSLPEDPEPLLSSLATGTNYVPAAEPTPSKPSSSMAEAKAAKAAKTMDFPREKPAKPWVQRNADFTHDGVRYISKSTLTEKMASMPTLKIIDVLSPESYRKHHIPGALNIPLGNLEKAGRILSKNTPLVVYCSSYSCGASTKAAKKLQGMGFETVFDYKGGIAEWVESGKAVATAPNKKGERWTGYNLTDHSAGGVDYISRDSLKGMMQGEKDFVLINVLPASYFESKRIPGSVNIPLAELNEETMATYEKDTPLVVYCANPPCQASTKAAKKLQSMGFATVFDYKGGIDDWYHAGMPVAGKAAEREAMAEKKAKKIARGDYLRKQLATSDIYTADYGVTYISKSKLQAMMREEKNLAVVDVLSPASYGNHHIAGAVNVPLGELKQAIEAGRFQKDQTLVVYCSSYPCGASTKAAKMLNDAGFEHVYDYKGGIGEWKEANLPTAGADGRP